MKIGIVQMQMNWTVAQNLMTISEHIESLVTLDILIFPELALSGFHRNIKTESKMDLIQSAVSELCHLAKKHKTTLFFGAPTVVGSHVFNSYLCISNTGRVVAQWDKTGLTESESSFFSKGGNREVLTINGVRCSAIICREVEDIDWFISQTRSSRPGLIIWPSYISQSGDERSSTGYFSAVSDIANKLGAFVLQCNWPHALNDQSISGLGGSRILGRDGKCIFTMPMDQVAVSILEFSEGSLQLVKPLSSVEAVL
ncbi:TPA: carbon-nitrogen hydrolase family protein [Vibrio parahaemolyticus]|nr:carbon-nitrogen hydrolase family protein [Vibrio parahaemolyticus]HCH1613885.1 carbon-nitrogen hydrolase family protein [Vibrio parahaemolyticus]